MLVLSLIVILTSTDSPEPQIFKSQKSEKLFHEVIAARFKTHQQIQHFDKRGPFHR